MMEEPPFPTPSAPPARPAPPPPPAKAVNWSVVGHRLRRPAFWLVLLSLLLVSSTASAVYYWNQRPSPAGPAPAPAGSFRFDQVFVLERNVTGNLTSFSIVPWFSNFGSGDFGPIRLAAYVIEVPRNVAVDVAEEATGALGHRRTQNATMDFTLNNTRSYRIEILVLENGFLLARGQGSIGFQVPVELPGYEGSGGRVSLEDQVRHLNSFDWDFEYPQGN